MQSSRCASIWSVLNLPISILSCIIIMATFPAVLENSVTRLGLLGFVIITPIIPLLFRHKRKETACLGGLLVLVAQILAFGKFSWWF